MVVPWTKAEVWGVVQLQVCFQSRAGMTDRGKMGGKKNQTNKKNRSVDRFGASAFEMELLLGLF